MQYRNVQLVCHCICIQIRTSSLCSVYFMDMGVVRMFISAAVQSSLVISVSNSLIFEQGNRQTVLDLDLVGLVYSLFMNHIVSLI